MQGFMCFCGLQRDQDMQWVSVYLSISANPPIYLQHNARSECSCSSFLSSSSSPPLPSTSSPPSPPLSSPHLASLQNLSPSLTKPQLLHLLLTWMGAHLLPTLLLSLRLTLSCMMITLVIMNIIIMIDIVTPSVRLAIAGVVSKEAFRVPGSAGRAGREPCHHHHHRHRCHPIWA